MLFFSRTRLWMQHLLTLAPEHQLYQMMMPTGFMTARDTGFSLGAAAGLQVVLALAAMVWIWRLWAHPAADRQLRLALSLVLVMLATPFGYNYDMIPVAIGAALLAAQGLHTPTWPGESVAFAVWVLPGLSSF